MLLFVYFENSFYNLGTNSILFQKVFKIIIIYPRHSQRALDLNEFLSKNFYSRNFIVLYHKTLFCSTETEFRVHAENAKDQFVMVRNTDSKWTNGTTEIRTNRRRDGQRCVEELNASKIVTELSRPLCTLKLVLLKAPLPFAERELPRGCKKVAFKLCPIVKVLKCTWFLKCETWMLQIQSLSIFFYNT